MIDRNDKQIIFDNTYIPEHIYTYVETISGAEAYYTDPFIYYLKDNVLVFIGYQLRGEFDSKRVKDIMKQIVIKTNCEKIKAIFPSYFEGTMELRPVSEDRYYILNVDTFFMKQKVRNMVNKASREIHVERTKIFTEEHRKLIEKFLDEKALNNEIIRIMKNIEAYIMNSNTALIINARNKEEVLVAFDIVDTFSRDFIFYMFNIRSKEHHILGASDLLLYEIIKMAKDMGKKFINLGLGINEGVRFFKEKWGGKVFLPYHFFEGELSKKTKIFSVIDRLLRIF